MKRPIQHVSEQAALTVVQSQLPKEWIVRAEHPDYGVDLSIEAVDNGIVTGQQLRAQVKGCARPEYRGRYVHFSCLTRHLQYWNRCSQPIVLFLVDLDRGEVYWNWIQALLWARPRSFDGQSHTIAIPLKNQLAHSVAELEKVFQLKRDFESLRWHDDDPAILRISTCYEPAIRSELLSRLFRFDLDAPLELVHQYPEVAYEAARAACDLDLYSLGAQLFGHIVDLLEEYDTPGIAISRDIAAIQYFWACLDTEPSEALFAQVTEHLKTGTLRGPDAEVLRATAAMRTGRPAEAAQLYRELLQRARADPAQFKSVSRWLLINLSNALELSGDLTRALECLDREVEEHGTSTIENLNRARLLMKLGRTDEAWQLMSGARKRLEHHREYWLLSAFVVAHRGGSDGEIRSALHNCLCRCPDLDEPLKFVERPGIPIRTGRDAWVVQNLQTLVSELGDRAGNSN